MPYAALALVPDLMASVRLESAVQRAGGRLTTAHHEAGFLEGLALTPRLAIVDLGTAGVDVVRVAEACKAAKVPLVAFGPHVDGRTLRAARTAGVEFVYTRSQFAADLNGILLAALAATEPASAGG